MMQKTQRRSQSRLRQTLNREFPVGARGMAARLKFQLQSGPRNGAGQVERNGSSRYRGGVLVDTP